MESMKLSLLLFSLCLVACSAVPKDFSIIGYSEEDLTSQGRLIDLFETWMAKHSKSYANLEERLRRFEIFKDNLKHIDETNKKRRSYWLGLNEFADMSHEEFKEKYLGLKPRSPGERDAASKSSKNSVPFLPKSVDWRKKGAVTQVKNQGTCGKSYILSARSSSFCSYQHLSKAKRWKYICYGGQGVAGLSRRWRPSRA